MRKNTRPQVQHTDKRDDEKGHLAFGSTHRRDGKKEHLWSNIQTKLEGSEEKEHLWFNTQTKGSAQKEHLWFNTQTEGMTRKNTFGSTHRQRECTERIPLVQHTDRRREEKEHLATHWPVALTESCPPPPQRRVTADAGEWCHCPRWSYQSCTGNHHNPTLLYQSAGNHHNPTLLNHSVGSHHNSTQLYHSYVITTEQNNLSSHCRLWYNVHCSIYYTFTVFNSLFITALTIMFITVVTVLFTFAHCVVCPCVYCRVHLVYSSQRLFTVHH